MIDSVECLISSSSFTNALSRNVRDMDQAHGLTPATGSCDLS